MTADQHVPAAQYLRMSTEHQQYSFENQSAAIQRYAETQGFHIIQTYCDAAKSGIVLRRRPGLRQLLQDVVAGTAPYRVILVYDVSRWGRFQDTDESAHYEFVCKAAGVPVHYCAETFANDGSLPSLIMKALKRTMAGEYSRELGVKVVEGQRRLARLGFKQGGSATWTRCHGTPSCMSHRAERRSNGSQTRSARSIRVSTCDKAPKIRTAVGRDKVFCVSVDRIARAISREGISTPKLVFVRNRLTSLDFAAQSSVASIPSTPNYESTRHPGRT
jgi:DNA invertase Pin-like site-specific DNA recombinase